MVILTPIERAVLDTTAPALENLEQIYQRLHAAPTSVPLAQAADAVYSLVEKGLLTLRPAGEEPLPDDIRRVWKARFEPTPEARTLLAEDSPSPPPGRIYPGMFKGRAPDVPFEVFKENRREMSRRYSGDAPDG